MRWFFPGFLLNQRNNREELMDRPDRIYWNEKKEKGFTGRGERYFLKKRFVKQGMSVDQAV